MNLAERFIIHIHDHHLFSKNDKLLVAVSGGVDSVVLCKLCQLAGFDFAIAHCNFQLRDEDSMRDEQFVTSLASRFHVPLHTIRFDTRDYALHHKMAIQEAARVLRYAWFEKIRFENQYDYILTAHHADDNIETVVMSFFRGTGIKGLTGIQEKNGKLIRPLLFASRQELEIFLQDNQLEYVQDESNFHDDYTRNYFRNTLLPMIAKVYPDVQANIWANIVRMKDVETLYRQAVEQYKKKWIDHIGSDAYMPVLLMQKTPAMQTVLYEILKEYGFSPAQTAEVIDLMESESGKYILSKTHRILKNRRHLIISPIKEIQNSFVIIEEEGIYPFPEGVIKMDTVSNHEISTDSNMAFLDADTIRFPLIVRPWKTGDYFYPLGMQKKKKLSRFFIDKKLSLIDKEKVWVIEMNKKILWVIGHRIDDRFKVTPSTKNILRLQYIKHDEVH